MLVSTIDLSASLREAINPERLSAAVDRMRAASLHCSIWCSTLSTSFKYSSIFFVNSSRTFTV